MRGYPPKAGKNDLIVQRKGLAEDKIQQKTYQEIDKPGSYNHTQEPCRCADHVIGSIQQQDRIMIGGLLVGYTSLHFTIRARLLINP